MSTLIKTLKQRFLYRALSAFFLGALCALSMAPASLWPLLFVCLSGIYSLFSLNDNKSHDFAIGWLFGFGYFIFSLSWIGNALLVEGNSYAWAWPLAVAGLPFILSFFFGFSFLIASAFKRFGDLPAFLALVFVWASAECCRGFWFTGFPWNLFAHSWVDFKEIIQITALSNVYALNMLTIFWASAAGYFLHQKEYRIPVIIIAIFSFVGVYGYGHLRLLTPPQFHSDTSVQIVQANISQSEKWKRDNLYTNFYEHLSLSQPSAQDPKQGTKIILWPETAFLDWMLNDPNLRQDLARTLQSHSEDTYLITGVLEQLPTEGLRNSLFVIDKNAEIIAKYNKHHLVPFGEYIPFQKLIPIQTITNFDGFVPGKGAKTIWLHNKLKFSPAICYEVIFSGTLFSKHEKPDFLVTITNDAWYGNSAGPHQHYVQAIFRAVESGIPMLRAANTGISSVISGHGIPIEKTLLFKKKSILQRLPKAL